MRACGRRRALPAATRERPRCAHERGGRRGEVHRAHARTLARSHACTHARTHASFRHSAIARQPARHLLLAKLAHERRLLLRCLRQVDLEERRAGGEHTCTFVSQCAAGRQTGRQSRVMRLRSKRHSACVQWAAARRRDLRPALPHQTRAPPPIAHPLLPGAGRACRTLPRWTPLACSPAG